MSDETAASKPEADGVDLKAEMDTRFQQQSEVLEKLSSTQAELLEALRNPPQPEPNLEPTSSEPEDLKDLIYTDPQRAVDIITKRTKEETLAAVKEQTSTQNQQAEVLNSLVNDYPELGDESSDLYKKAIENYKNLTPSEKDSITGYKIAVQGAALDMGVRPKKYRKTASADDFTFPGGGQGAGRSEQNDTKITGFAAEFARKAGFDTSDPAFIKQYNEGRKKHRV